MSFVKKLTILVVGILVITSLSAAAYVENNKDTKQPPESVVYVINDPDDMQLLYETNTYKFYFRDYNDTLAVFDKRNGYTWKSGLDITFDEEIKEMCELYLEEHPDATDEEKLANCQPLEDNMNWIYESLGNSLLSIEYYADTAFNIKTVSSTSGRSGYSSSTLMMVDESHYRLDIRFLEARALDVQIKLHIYLSDEGFSLEVRDEEITGDDVNLIHSIILAPFMGASGGQQIFFNPEINDYDDDHPVMKERIPGYMFVPDGSGALMRFDDYESSLTGYSGDIYGVDRSQNPLILYTEQGFVPFKEPTMPVYGIAHGNRQAAFVGFSDQGDEFLEIESFPSGNKTSYNYVYAKFVYNRLYTQVYNQTGAGYPTLFEERNHFDAKMNYHFLAGDGSTDRYPADYVGMALYYRDFLIDTGVLEDNFVETPDIPIRLDFIMSDAMKSLVGTTDVVVTNTEQVEDILTDLYQNDVNNINAGLYGYQSGGVTLGRKSRPNWNGAIGSKGAFEDLVEAMNLLGIDVSLAQDYTTIYEEQMGLIGNATKHISGWYIALIDFYAIDFADVSYFATPGKMTEWVASNAKAINDMGFNSMTFDGISRRLYSNYGRDITTVTDAIKMYQEAFDKISDTYKVNMVTPNQYLWRVTNRYLQAPLFNSQFLVETDTVPFLQIVLNHQLEVYSTYVNFSFYTQADILRMIDYNTFPSFVLTNDPSYELVNTKSNEFYSTEYQLYKEMIQSVYNKINSALGEVYMTDWIDRQVLAPGVILNMYENGTKIVINYTESVYEYEGQTVGSENFRVFN